MATTIGISDLYGRLPDYVGTMSVKVDLGELAAKIAEFDVAYLVTVSDEGRAHVLSVWPEITDDGIVVDGVGRHTQANAAAHPDVTLVFPPADPAATACSSTARRRSTARRSRSSRPRRSCTARPPVPTAAAPAATASTSDGGHDRLTRTARGTRVARRGRGYGASSNPAVRRRRAGRGRSSATPGCTGSARCRAGRRSWRAGRRSRAGRRRRAATPSTSSTRTRTPNVDVSTPAIDDDPVGRRHVPVPAPAVRQRRRRRRTRRASVAVITTGVVADRSTRTVRSARERRRRRRSRRSPSARRRRPPAPRRPGDVQSPTRHGSSAPAGGAGTSTSWHHWASERAASVGPAARRRADADEHVGAGDLGRSSSASAATPGHAQPPAAGRTTGSRRCSAAVCPSAKRRPRPGRPATVGHDEHVAGRRERGTAWR